jgi:hypothetical protein
MTHIRGLHEAAGLRTIRIAGATPDRSKLTATLARLDHQRTLLARQFAVWTKKLQVTQLRLGVLDKEIAETWRRIRESGGPYRALDQSNGTAAIKTEPLTHGGGAAVRRGDVSIDY